MKFGTLAVHAGVVPDPTTGAIMTPIYQTSTYVQHAPGDHKGYEYSRTENPTRDALQAALAALETGAFGLCFASGMAAVDSIMKLLNPGDEVVACNDMYGGTYRLFTEVFQRFGIKFRFVDMSDSANVRAAITANTKMIWVETPTNPLLNIIDIAAISALGKERGIWTVVDNTFATPYVQQPLLLGASIVMHSVTKYLAGHSDVIMGAAIMNDENIYNKLKFIQNSCGAVPGPQDCFLVLRGIKTLHVRMRQHCISGRAIAAFLASHPKVGFVRYPGLERHPGFGVAEKQMKDFGGMISFGLKEDSIAAGLKFIQKLKLFSLAESLGGVESLVGHPATMTHASIPREERLKSGLTDSMLRLSVGIEDTEDLIADLAQALD